jgi:hypothetical protein
LVPYFTAPSLALMPYWVTMARATADAFSMSLPAPGGRLVEHQLLGGPTTQRVRQRVDHLAAGLGVLVLGRQHQRVPERAPRGRMVTLCTGASCGIAQATRA